MVGKMINDDAREGYYQYDSSVVHANVIIEYDDRRRSGLSSAPLHKIE